MSRFIRKKDNLKEEGLNLFKKILAMNIQVRMLRMDNAKQNKLIKKILEAEEFNINFQYTTAGTPQQNGRVERKFATLYGNVCSTLYSARISKGL